ncbi:hypothetical protein CFC21_055097 [Triticum aestivum]|uniref:Uncharacterized protein n=1 Tax=Triticum aestivum TaxID=4565 RepID=A0A9R1K9Q0_WHEAT|nr:hypothetical protein CFC21_055097 [Triticum aestivum]
MGFLVPPPSSSSPASSPASSRSSAATRGAFTNIFHLTLVITATVCCWMMWAIVYLAQMKPLINPILSGE